MHKFSLRFFKSDWLPENRPLKIIQESPNLVVWHSLMNNPLKISDPRPCGGRDFLTLLDQEAL